MLTPGVQSRVSKSREPGRASLCGEDHGLLGLQNHGNSGSHFTSLDLNIFICKLGAISGRL
jgi:hypothetical protein